MNSRLQPAYVLAHMLRRLPMARARSKVSEVGLTVRSEVLISAVPQDAQLQ